MRTKPLYLTKKGELKQQVILLLIAVCLVVIGFTIPEIEKQFSRPKHYEQDGRNLQNLEGENLDGLPAVSPN